VFGAVGRFSKVKGFDVLLRLFATVALAATQDVRLVLVGQGPEEPALRNQTRELGLGDRVVFAPFSDAPWEAMNAFDAFVLPSRTEGLPFALMEAMACGCCCIAMRVGGVGELLSERRFGWLVEAGNEQEFTAAMEDAINLSDGDRRRMGMLARERIIDGFTQADQLSKIATLIEA
jgi:glycosyltransferase involved in cell wall biosynthesis